jgi:ketosteroid isomerase-like protein
MRIGWCLIVCFYTIVGEKGTSPMPELQNIDLVKKLYEAYGKGDIDTIINHLADHFDWRFDAPSIIPFAGNQQTRDEVRRRFFGSLAESQKDQSLSPQEFIAQDDKVVMLGRYTATVVATGRSIDLRVAHVFTIQNGKVTRFLNLTDTARVAEAYTAG